MEKRFAFIMAILIAVIFFAPSTNAKIARAKPPEIHFSDSIKSLVENYVPYELYHTSSPKQPDISINAQATSTDNNKPLAQPPKKKTPTPVTTTTSSTASSSGTIISSFQLPTSGGGSGLATSYYAASGWLNGPQERILAIYAACLAALGGILLSTRYLRARI